MVYSGNRYLTKDEMKVNAEHIANILVDMGWTENSIAGILGNMESESTMNPELWEDLNEGNTSRGFGLVQWTPATKLIDWANSNNKNYKTIEVQLERLQYEIDKSLQWISTSDYPMSFIEFTKSNDNPEKLASVFLKNYERAGIEVEEERREQARYWFDNLGFEGGSGEKPCFPTSSESVITSEYGWRIHPIHGGNDFHAGIDLASPNGGSQPIYATQSGKVLFAGDLGTAGYTVILEHTGDPYFSRYLHMVKMPDVKTGDSVSKCQKIGDTGETGGADGIHLHFEVGTSEDGLGTENGTIDPESYLEMSFGGGSQESGYNSMIELLLTDTLNGWKF